MSDTFDLEEILIVPLTPQAASPAPYDPMRGGPDPLRGGDGGPVAMRFGEFAGQFRAFIGQIQRLLEIVPEAASGYSLDEVEVSAVISASGKLALLGVGGESGIESGLKFVFKRGAAAAKPAGSDHG